jgi:hypothetical protein
MAKLRRHRKQAHPKAHRESVKKALKTKGILDPEKLKARRGLINKPHVLGYSDYKCSGLVRILRRVEDIFPEFALYPSGKTIIVPSLLQAGFNEESRGKWVLRTNKFNIFVYI